jgi:hypothetical protein
VLVLAHGAGAPQTHPLLVLYAKGLVGRGVDVLTFNSPYAERAKNARTRRRFSRVCERLSAPAPWRRLLAGGTDLDALSSLAARLARLDHECDAEQRKAVREAAGGVPHTALTGARVAATGPDRQVAR